MTSATVSLRELITPQRTCGVAILLRHRVNRGKQMVVGALCGSWHCDTCGPYLRRKWTEHLTGKIIPADSVCVTYVEKGRWRTVSRRITRAGGQYAIIEQSEGILAVFTDAQEGEPVTKAVAMDRLEKAIAGAVTEKRPIHTSRGWGLPKGEAPKMGQWERIGRLAVTVDVAKKTVEAIGLRVSSFFTDLQTGFVVDISEWGSGDSDEVFRQFTDVLLGVPR